MVTQVRILIDECGAPLDSIVEVTEILDDGHIMYTWEDITFMASPEAWALHYPDSAYGYDSQSAGTDINYEILRNAAEQFLVFVEEEKLDEAAIDYFYDVFKETLGK
ncbi:hypothetical protein [Xanthomonas phage X1]|nr:hypothetical protein [Xanthomonas phage X1]